MSDIEIYLDIPELIHATADGEGVKILFCNHNGSQQKEEISRHTNHNSHHQEYQYEILYATRKKMYREYQERQAAAQRAKEEAERDAIIPTVNFKSTVRVIK